MRTTLLSVLFLSAALAVISSFSSGVSSSFDATGSPLAGRTCASCHVGTSLGTETNIQLRDVNGRPQSEYIPGQQYSVELSYTTTSAASAFGMQAVILDGQNGQAGQIGAPPAGTRVRQRSGIDYIDHSQRLQGDTIAFDWTAPAAGTGDVSIYAVINAVNSNGGTSGDTADEAELTISESTSQPPLVYHPRALADLRGVNANGIPDSLGNLIEVEGIVYGFDTEPNVSNFNILNDDGTAGLAILNNSDTLNYTATEGDRVILRGKLSQVVGLTYLEAVEVEIISQNITLPVPITTEALDESLEGRLVNLDGLTMIDTASWQTNPTATYDFRFLTRGGDTVIAQIAEGMPIWGEPLPGAGIDQYLVTGVVRQFDLDDPLLEGHYILPRSGGDFIFLLSNKEIRDFDLIVTRFGESLTVEAPSAIQNIRLVDLNGRILSTHTVGGGQLRTTFNTERSKTPLSVLWVQLKDGRQKAVFVR